ncbi:ABC transporter ATP-binding protein [Chachezhania antarctica]|uniref:ABC transporter ATP-binding protein n=1 Tax=Chachezhania antarctica TaxID=2340860 RepID=UPI000EAC755A|nr:ABC transporter ATP-binding protein [Chachezhania antarctica]|tara:strand:+ start:3999 stop:5003 length:1005 start_codon:yes stop_codon:yes gene_type:complete
MTDTAPFLEIIDLSVEMKTETGTIRVLDNVSLQIRRGTTLGIVGESGCGKSMTALAMMRLLPPGFEITSGQIILDGEDITRASDARMRALRGNDISMIFQEPMTSLNPVFTVGDQIAEAVRQHQGLDKAKAEQRAIEMLKSVQIPGAEARLHSYPHEFSGGMRQRVMIAMALACQPRLIIADEPTTALDVTVQAQIFALMRELQEETGTAIMLITHDLGAVAELADDVAVFYSGWRIESGPAASILRNASHPYTSGLMSCTPRLRLGKAAAGGAADLREIAGMVPQLGQMPQGCRFAPRCALADDHCRSAVPPDVGVAPAHSAKCWKTEAEVLA